MNKEQIAKLKEFKELRQAATNASFDCGEFDDRDDAEGYRNLALKANSLNESLDSFVELLLSERTTSPVSQMTDEQRSVLMSHAVLFEYSGFIDQARHLRDIVAASAPAAPGPDPAPIYKHHDDGTVILTNAGKMPSYADIDKVAWKIHEAHAAQPQPQADESGLPG